MAVSTEIAAFKTDQHNFNTIEEQHQYAKTLLDAGKVRESWMVLL